MMEEFTNLVYSRNFISMGVVPEDSTENFKSCSDEDNAEPLSDDIFISKEQQILKIRVYRLKK